MRRRGDVDKKRGETEKVNQDKMLNQAKRLVYSTNAPNEVKDDWGDGGEEKAHCSKKPAVEVVGWGSASNTMMKRYQLREKELFFSFTLCSANIGG